jgi:hypothetical protein
MALPKQKDPLVVELERICKEDLVTPTTFVHANMEEANFGLDQLSDIEFPVLVHIASNRNRTKVNEAHHLIRTVKVTALLLNRIPLDTLEYKSGEVNAEVNFMRQLGENLIYWINKSDLSVNGGVSDFESDDVYQRMDAHLFGQAMSFDWSLDTATTGYYNNPGE